MTNRPKLPHSSRPSAKIVPFPRQRHVRHWRNRFRQFITLLGRGAATPTMLGENVHELDWQNPPSGQPNRRPGA